MLGLHFTPTCVLLLVCSLRFTLTDHTTRPPHHHSREKVTPLPPKFSMDQEKRKQHVWCHHGLLRRSRNVRVNRSLHVILDSTKIQKWSWSVPWRWPRNLQDHSKEIEKTKQEVCQVFKSNGLKITIEANKKVVNFLDVTFNLTNGCYKPFMKPNNKLSYVHQQSNHPQHY